LEGKVQMRRFEPYLLQHYKGCEAAFEVSQRFWEIISHEVFKLYLFAVS
jgi:hypothetical protein